MPRITPFLWFEDEAEAAVQHYLSIFRDARILEVTRFGEGAPRPAGTVMTLRFLLEGQEFTALNGGPYEPFSAAVSFVIACETQADLDHYWAALAEGGEAQPCGWLKDRFGVTWQVVPRRLAEMLRGGDPAAAQRMMGALFQMTKIDLAALEAAYRGA